MDVAATSYGPWLMGILFILGYGAIVLEHYLKVNKAAVALLTGCALWAVYFLSYASPHEQKLSALNHHLGSVSEIVFFLMAAMTIVELIDGHRGFNLLTRWIRPMSKRSMLLVIGLLTFFISSLLDNLTTTLVMVSLLKRFIEDREERLLAGGLVVIAANAGGAWTVIGDVTTTMLWIKGALSAAAVMKVLFVPSFVSLLVAVTWIGRSMKGSYQAGEQERELEPRALLVSVLGILVFIMTPILKAATHLPAYMAILFGLSLLWLVSDRLHRAPERAHLRLFPALKRIDSSSLLFFLGILLAVGALEQAQLLSQAARSLDQLLGSKMAIATLIGLLSAVIDNVPLVAASMSMYSLQDYGPDHPLWQWIAFCAGTGGSILIIGSAAGVALMSLERVSFTWYAKRIGLCAFASYLVGVVVLLLLGYTI